ncbi:unnamed protein product [Arabis nemorensis]|uniref:Uncharacterized protein n=1 Tax=Arabis nemorensis TaxID=586526 RepID=A0A565B484_9BRAS|nr:unnamed protein product [Arabis nemorensis]
MAIHKLPFLLLLSIILLFLNRPVLSDTDEEDILFRDLTYDAMKKQEHHRT